MNVDIISQVIYDPAHPDMARLDIYRPEEVKGAYVFFHGGGLQAGDKAHPKNAALLKALAEQGILCFSANYRFLPQLPGHQPHPSPENGVSYDEILRDAASAVKWVMTEGRAYGDVTRLTVGGPSAGAYLAMMLLLDEHYLREKGIDPKKDIHAYMLDSGQPTAHFRMLALEGRDMRQIVVDERAPLWYLTKTFEEPETLPRLRFIAAENDMPGRLEQNRLLMATLAAFGYPEEKMDLHVLPGYQHIGYLADPRYRRLCAELVLS